MFHPSAADVLGPNDPPINGQCGMTSLCHPWGALPCRYLNEVVAGIQPTTPGFATVDIMPHLGRRLTAAAATTPTPRGPVSAMCDVNAGVSRVVLPAGVSGRIGIPKVERASPASPSTAPWPGMAVSIPWPASPARARTPTLSPSAASRPAPTTAASPTRASAPAARETPVVFPVRCLGEDRHTRGNWGGVHGRDGYVLPDYDGVGKDVRKLPSYIGSVTLHRCAYGVGGRG